MELRDVLRVMRRNWWLILLVTATALGIGGLVTMVTAPMYATSVTFFVTTPGQGVTDAYQGGLFSQQRIASYSVLLSGDRLARGVGAEPGVNLTPRQVQDRIMVRNLPDTVLLEATVTDRSKARSQRMAAALGRSFGPMVENLETPQGSSTPAVKVEVVAGPTLNPDPVSPRPVRDLALATLLGLLAGIGIAVLRETLDSTVASADVLRDVSDAAVLAVVPYDQSASDAPVLIEGGRYCKRAEALRHLRTNLQFIDVDGQVKTLVVTSAVPEEGKSTVAMNVAITFAQAGRRVLLIEADLRRPRVADYLDLERAVGLSDVLVGRVELDDVLQRWGRHELSVLPSGAVPPNPSELLGSLAMAALLNQVRDRFDMVVIDTPPLLPVTDAAVLAKMVDGAMTVVRCGKTPQGQVKAALARLRAVDARVLGCVLNMQPVRAGTDAEDYYAYTDDDLPTPPASPSRHLPSQAAPTRARTGRSTRWIRRAHARMSSMVPRTGSSRSSRSGETDWS